MNRMQYSWLNIAGGITQTVDCATPEYRLTKSEYISGVLKHTDTRVPMLPVIRQMAA